MFIEVLGFLEESSPRSPMPGGDFENPEGNPPGPRAGAEAGERREKIPDGLRGFVAKIPEQITRILCIFFSNDFTSTTNHSANNPASQKYFPQQI